MRPVLSILLAALILGSPGPVLAQRSAASEGPTFRSGIDLVTVTAVVRDAKGRVVSDLGRLDFELLDNGRHRPIAGFRPDVAPISLALLFDASGSMQVASKIEEARAAARQILAWLRPDKDEAAIFAFDTSLREVQPFTRQADVLGKSVSSGFAPFGMTSLHDAIAATARQTAARPNAHRAVIVLTDGVDNNSRLTPPEVSGIASSIDVPVYILAIVSPLDHPGMASAVNSERPLPVGDLADLARWTGGELFVTSAPSHASVAAREIVNELRHQYLIAFEPTGHAGWHPLEVRTRRGDLVVRARSGYMAGPSLKN